MSKNIEQLLGSDKKYRLSDQVKKYTLKDFGFIESSPGKFRYERSLAQRANDPTFPVLKFVISNELSKLKISVTNPSGLQRINIYEKEDMGMEQMIAETVFFEMVEAGILDEV